MSKPEEKSVSVTIPPVKMETVKFRIVGTAPYVQARFSEKARIQMEEKHKAGSTAKGKKERKPRDFEDEYRQAMHIATDGWPGLPASSIRAAMISACRLVNFKMTLAKLSIFVKADGLDKVDGVPLIRLDGKHEMNIGPVRNETGVIDLRARPMWREWEAVVRIEFDTDQFTLTDVTNLLQRVGIQVGLGEGRPDSRKSAGLGWGTFRIA